MVLKKFEKGKINEKYKRFSKEEKQELEDYLKYRVARGINSKGKLDDIKRVIIQLRINLAHKFDTIDLTELRSLVADINSSDYGDFHKNDLKCNLKNFLKWKFRDWSLRFDELRDIKLKGKPTNQKVISPSAILKEADIKKLIQHENSIFWKSFLLTQFEAGLRTKEVRFLKWEDVKLYADGEISELNIFATKTGKSRSIFVKEASFYLNKLKTEQENLKQKGIYVFHSKRDLNEPISQARVSEWIKILTKKTFGESKKIWNYLLRHSRATLLYRLAKEGKISKDIAQEFLGHGKDMSDVYTHLDSETIKEMLKSQVYNFEDEPEETKNELKAQIEQMQKQLSTILKWIEHEEEEKMREAQYQDIPMKNFKIEIKKLKREFEFPEIR